MTITAPSEGPPDFSYKRDEPNLGPFRQIKGAADDRRTAEDVEILPDWREDARVREIETKKTEEEEAEKDDLEEEEGREEKRAWESRGESSDDEWLDDEGDTDPRPVQADGVKEERDGRKPAVARGTNIGVDGVGERRHVMDSPIIIKMASNLNAGDEVKPGNTLGERRSGYISGQRGVVAQLSTVNDQGRVADVAKKDGSDMADMRIASERSLYPPKYNAGIQDILRHPEAHAGKERQQTCSPKNNIVMLKTHKCSSSTMQNILFRWGENHNLTFALPWKGVYLGSPDLFNERYVMPANGGHYNILANHMRYDKQAVEDLMPADSIYITLVRNPASQFESMYSYYRFDGRFRVPLDQFMKRPRAFFFMEPRIARHVGRNPMLFDMGLDARNMERDDGRVKTFIEQIDKRFDLVLVAEHFKESLILLKEKLCWTLEDIVFFNQNARSKTSVRQLSGQLQQRIIQWNGADNALYQYFNRTLWQRIAEFGHERMAREIAELDRRNEELSRLCIGATKEQGDRRVYYPPGISVNSFILSSSAKGNQLCDQMTRPELTYIGVLRSQQISRDRQQKVER
ncbi:galactose-3-O-sulfotransferase 2-like [Diadema antillarum]|uniref:galactose-3-O-sulfotransferase 2-like n=1 Tax=Diadema antillarum TaxID=105358 RepID=UPI003A8A67CC